MKPRGLGYYLTDEEWRTPMIRQVCRRAALECWREARNLASGPPEHFGYAAWRALQDCINFRAAARAR